MSNEPIHVSDAEFEEKVLQADVPVLWVIRCVLKRRRVWVSAGRSVVRSMNLRSK